MGDDLNCPSCRLPADVVDHLPDSFSDRCVVTRDGKRGYCARRRVKWRGK